MNESLFRMNEVMDECDREIYKIKRIERVLGIMVIGVVVVGFSLILFMI